MALVSSLMVGALLSVLVRQLMKERSYGPIDDLIWGVLGVLLGGGIADVLGLSTFGQIVTLLMAIVGASAVLLATGLVKQQ